MEHLRWFLVAMTGTLVAGVLLAGEPKMNKDVQEIIKKCTSNSKCSSLARTIQVVDRGSTQAEPILFLRSPMVNELKIARFKGEDGAYIVFIIPEGSVDMGIVRIFQGDK